MKRQVEELGTVSPVHVIANGVNVERFRPAADATSKAALRRRLGLDPASTIVMSVGPIIPRKGTDSLVDAFCSLWRERPDARLVLVGPRHDLARAELADFRRRLAYRIDTSGAGEHVIFTGAVDNVCDYLQAADIMVFASRREGMPNVVPEAMACGLPVVMTPFVGLSQEFGEAGTHYIRTDWEPDTMASDLRQLLSDPEARANLGARARDLVTHQLDVNQSLNSYSQLYRSLATA